MKQIATELVVVGAGPGGYAAAFYAADRGKKVLLVEQDRRLGGVCLNRGCIPTKTLLEDSLMIAAARACHFMKGDMQVSLKRIKERKKYGLLGARKSPQYHKR